MSCNHMWHIALFERLIKTQITEHSSSTVNTICTTLDSDGKCVMKSVCHVWLVGLMSISLY